MITQRSPTSCSGRQYSRPVAWSSSVKSMTWLPMRWKVVVYPWRRTGPLNHSASASRPLAPPWTSTSSTNSAASASTLRLSSAKAYRDTSWRISSTASNRCTRASSDAVASPPALPVVASSVIVSSSVDGTVTGDHQGVQGHRALPLFQDQQGVHVDLGDRAGQLHPDRLDGHDGVEQRLNVGGGSSPHPGQERVALQFGQHPTGLVPVERRDPERHVAEHLHH